MLLRSVDGEAGGRGRPDVDQVYDDTWRAMFWNAGLKADLLLFVALQSFGVRAVEFVATISIETAWAF